uniref:EGF-like domain-containing protein n=1 Tax=Cyprinus carpio carpio TaxID=630221 RepID=A0A9J8CQZ2_CYPCA
MNILSLFYLSDPEGSGTDTTDTPATTKQGTHIFIASSSTTKSVTIGSECPTRITILFIHLTGPCDSSPCIGDSTCEARFDGTFVCICRPGLVYNQISGCIQTKIFPGSLTLSEMFKPEMTDRKSEEQGSIIAEVQNSVCDLGACDNKTTNCEELVSGVAMCTCKEGYVRSESTSQACLACPNGQKAVDSKICEKCPFGYAGFNCNDPYLLVVIVVSTVLGALLIIFIVALIVVSFRNQKEDSSSEVDFSSSYGNKELHKPTGIPRIPRANPEASWKSNNLEMTDSGSNHALVIRDRPESKARYTDFDEDMSYRGHAPPAYSGYGGRGVDNGGVHNPYFRHDDDRMRRY